VILNNIRATGNNLANAGTGHAVALVTLARDFGTTSAINSIQLSNLNFSTRQNNPCLVAFDDDAGGTATQIDVNRARLSINESSINNLGSSTGAKAFCVGDLNSVHLDASNDTGILAQRVRPTWRGIRVNGAGIPDKDWPTMVLADAGTCAPDKKGQIVEVYDHNATTCPGTPTFTAGTSRTTCKCDGGNWVNP
jgi:hypothetical protein